MKRLTVLGLALAWLALATSCLFGETLPPSETLRPYAGEADLRIKKLLGSYWRIYAAPDRIDSYIVGPELAESGQTIEGYPVLRRGAPLTAAQAEILISRIFDENTYNFNSVKKCPFVPRLGLVFRKGEDSAHVLLCFYCYEVSYGRGDKGSIEDFDNARRPLVTLAQQLFPDDEIIRGLEAGQ
jgi:hypothetical protein